MGQCIVFLVTITNLDEDILMYIVQFHSEYYGVLKDVKICFLAIILVINLMNLYRGWSFG